jgi:hypothetical protein
LELSHPNIFSRTERIQEIVRGLQTELGLEDHWEYKLAARLGLLGFAVLPEDERGAFEITSHIGGSMSERFRRAAAAGQRLIERIPRLATVAKIIGMQPDVDGSAVIQIPRTEDAKAIMGATLLRVAVQWDDALRQGQRSSAAIEDLRKSLPRLSLEITNALRDLPLEEDVDEGVEVGIRDLQEGMVLCDDVLSGNGDMLIRKGRRLTWTIVERLRSSHTPADGLRPIRVRASSIAKPDQLVHA